MGSKSLNWVITALVINICSASYRVFIKYCVFFRRFLNMPDSCLYLFSLGVSMCTHTRQVEHQRCSRTGRIKKSLKENTIFNVPSVAVLLLMNALTEGQSSV